MIHNTDISVRLYNTRIYNTKLHARAGHLGFAVLELMLKKYFQAKISTKISYIRARHIKIINPQTNLSNKT